MLEKHHFIPFIHHSLVKNIFILNCLFLIQYRFNLLPQVILFPTITSQLQRIPHVGINSDNFPALHFQLFAVADQVLSNGPGFKSKEGFFGAFRNGKVDQYKDLFYSTLRPINDISVKISRSE